MEQVSRLFIPLLFVSMVACGQNTNVQTVSIDKANKLLENPDLQIVDVRTQEEYESGFIQGAQLITLNSAGFNEKVKTLDKNKPVMVYCLSGGRSTTAANTLAKMDFSKVYNMSEGMMNWKRTGQHVAMPQTKNKEASEQNGTLTQKQFLELTKSSKIVLIDFYAPWCAPCKKMVPSLKAMESTYGDQGLKIVNVDIDQNEILVREYGLESIPRLFLYKNGELVKDFKGYQTRDQLEEALKAAL